MNWMRFDWGRRSGREAVVERHGGHALATAVLLLGAIAFLLPACSKPPVTTCAACVERKGCSFSLADPSVKIDDTLAKQLGCGPFYHYQSGGHGEAYGSFCPDTPASRVELHATHRSGYHSGYCETCIGVPEGQIFVLWEDTFGHPHPSCPSSCVNF